MSDILRNKYYALNDYAWPPKTATEGWPPRVKVESAAYARSRDEMEGWIRRDLKGYKPKFDEWATLVQSRMMPSFTKDGFQVVDMSGDPLYAELLANYAQKVRDPAAFAGLRREGMSTSAGADAPKFYSQPQLNQRLLDAMRPKMEAWAGVELNNGQSYGVRVYQNGSTLVNHIDRSETHVISAIVHIDHDLAEPWPLEIEDHDGKWHEVNLEPGQACYYESAKQYHARLRPMLGKHYGSVFLHWYPKHDWNWTMWDTHVAVPPDFEVSKSELALPERAFVYDLPLPPFIRAYEAWWRERGFVPPPLRRGIEDPVQSFNKDTLERLDAAPPPRVLALHAAAQLGDVVAVSRLLAEGADADALDSNGWAAVHEAVRSGSLATVQKLVEHSSAALRRQTADDGGTARWWARQLHGAEHDIVRFLADMGAPDEGVLDGPEL